MYNLRVNRNSFVSTFTLLLLIVTVSQLHRPFATLFAFSYGPVKTSFGLFTAIFGVYFLVYILANWQPFVKLLHTKIGILWIFLCSVYPTLSLSWAVSTGFREVSLSFYYFSMSAVAAVYVTKWGIQSINKISLWSFVVVVISVFISTIYPQAFKPVVEVTGDIVFQDRGIGIYLDPNATAYGLILLYILANFLRISTYIKKWAAVGALLLTVILTGSRSGIIIASVVVYIDLFVGKSLLFGKDMSGPLRQVSGFILVLILITIGYGLFHSVGGTWGIHEPITRITTLLDQIVTGEYGYSIRGRALAAVEHITLIVERPILGHGAGADGYYLDQGLLHKSAHNTILKRVLKYGIAYLGLMAVLIYYIVKRVYIYSNGSVRLSMIIILIATFGISLVTGSLFTFEPFIVLFGTLWAISCDIIGKNK